MQWKSFAQAGTLPFRPPHLQIYVPLAFCVLPWWPFPQRCCPSRSHHQALRVQSVQARKAQEEAMAQGKPQAAPPSWRGRRTKKKDESKQAKTETLLLGSPSSFIKMLLRFSHCLKRPPFPHRFHEHLHQYKLSLACLQPCPGV